MNACCIVPPGPEIGGGRVGTVIATQTELEHLFGPPTNPSDPDGKVTRSWVIKTPRGHAELRDYWWNAPTEWPIGAATRKTTLWAKRFLRRHGLAVDPNGTL